MSRSNYLLPRVMRHVRWPVLLTWAGLIAQELIRSFWPLWSWLAVFSSLMMFGLHEHLGLELLWGLLMFIGSGALYFAAQGVWLFSWPSRQDALNRLDQTLSGRPFAALHDSQAMGLENDGSQELWAAHQNRMADEARAAKTVKPDMRLSSYDLYGFRYIGLLGVMLALVFGSVSKLATVDDAASGQSQTTVGPSWEGWVDPPAYTQLPSLYLNDLQDSFRVPVGSKITLRLYGQVGALNVSETVSGRTDDIGAASDAEQDFLITRSGELRIDGTGGQSWDINANEDLLPEVTIAPAGENINFDGQMQQPFTARDDYGIVSGLAQFQLRLDAMGRRHGLAIDPEPRSPIELDLPLPITGDRSEFSERLIENLSDHPWAHMPVSLSLSVQDAKGQTGRSLSKDMMLPARRFFDPLASTLVEQRRDLLWSLQNAPRVTRVLKAISYGPSDAVFQSNTVYLKLRFVIKRLETLDKYGQLDGEARDELAKALWDLALLIEDGDIGDALERMRAAQERLSEAIRNGASEEDIARLMQELRDATNDFLRQQAQQNQRENDRNGLPQMSQDMIELGQQDLQNMMDRVQELMKEGRFAEAQQALEELQQMVENMQVTQGQQGQGEDQQAMEELGDTLRDQQGLTDEAFRDLQEQFNPNTQSGQSQGNTGHSGGEGEGQNHDGTGSGEGAGEDQAGRGEGGSLAERQEALREELQRQRGSLPGAGTTEGDAAREALDRAGRAMQGAEQALRENNLGSAIDQQAEAIDALRDGMRSLGEAMANSQHRRGGQGDALGQFGESNADPLGRSDGNGINRNGTGDDGQIPDEDGFARARELLDEIRRRSTEQDRSKIERDYLQRLLDRF